MSAPGAARWRVVDAVATVAELHAPRPVGEPEAQIVVCTPTDRALTAGRHPPVSRLVARAAAEAGWTVVERGSGGGVVLVVPGECWWVDVLVPSGHPCWDDDVTRTMLWFGERWVEALEASGALPGGAARVHRGALRAGGAAGTLGEAVCFAGVGPGEVLDAEGRKLVGLAQRRQKGLIRVQCMVHARWDPERYRALGRAAGVPAASGEAGPAWVDEVATLAAGSWERVLGALVSALTGPVLPTSAG